ncbi:MAG: twin-arginine translocase subunit TatC [Actinomycetota bacterium]
MAIIPKLLRRPAKPRDGSMTLIEHLEELRYRLVISFMAVGLGSIVGWFLYKPVIRLLQEPYCDTVKALPQANQPDFGGDGCAFIFLGTVDGAIVKIKVVVFIGLAVTIPIVLYQLWRFIVPGLTRRERRMAVPFIFSATLLFAFGVTLAYVTLPKALEFLLGFAGEGFVPLLTGDKYLSFFVFVSLAFGLSFEFPILLIFLMLVGVLSSRRLRDWRRNAILGVAIFAAVITPSQDPYTMLGMMVPMILLYEAAIVVGRLMKR